MSQQGEFFASGVPTLGVQALVDMEELSYDDYFKKINGMIKNLKHDWDKDEKVKALKIVIQLTKLLASTNQLKLYQKKYKIITDLLDEFGNLVYNRIQAKAREEFIDTRQFFDANRDKSTSKHPLHCNISPIDQAKETCRNWFLKVASIRELVPRFYTELAILKSCDILIKPSSTSTADKFNIEQIYFKSLDRLTKAAFGFGDPLVALHARAYLCKAAQRLISLSNTSDCLLFDLVLLNLQASIQHISRSNLLDASVLTTRTGTCHNSESELLIFDLVSGCLQSIMHIVTYSCDLYDDDNNLEQEVLIKIETLYTKLLNQVVHEECTNIVTNIVIHSLLRALPSDILINRSSEILSFIKRNHDDWTKTSNHGYMEVILACVSTHMTMESFAIVLNECDNFGSDIDFNTKNLILKTILNIMNDLKAISSRGPDKTHQFYHLRCYKAWLSYANNYLDDTTVNPLLNRFVEAIKVNCQRFQQHRIILELIKSLVSSRKTLAEIDSIFDSRSFLQLVELLRKDDHRFEISSWILETMRANLKLYNGVPVMIANRSTMKFILRLFAMMNGSINLLTATEDIERLSSLVFYFIEIIFHEDYEQKLNAFARYRSLLSNLNPVMERLARDALNLPLQFEGVEKKRGSRQSYLNSCLAYTFVTVPAIKCHLTRFGLYIDGASLALKQMSLSIADYYVKQIVFSLTESIKLATAQSLYDNYNNGVEIAQKESRNIDRGHDCRTDDRILLDKVYSLVDLMLNYEDHIDLKHRLVLSNLITESFSKHSKLLKTVKLLKLVDADAENFER